MKKILTLVTFVGLLQAESMSYTEYVHVHSSTPQYQMVSQQVPYQECYDRQVPNMMISGGYSQDNRVGSMIGGAIGGVLGHQVGRGKGKDAATIGGAILGTMIGGNVLQNRPQQRYQTYETRRQCTTRYRQSVSHRELSGYQNIAYYKGKRIVKFSTQPLQTIAVQVTIDY